jgi:hypothetical protein
MGHERKSTDVILITSSTPQSYSVIQRARRVSNVCACGAGWVRLRIVLRNFGRPLSWQPSNVW